MSKTKKGKKDEAYKPISLKEIVPSKNVRDHFKRVGFAFDDRTCASIIWNHELLSRSKKLKLLKTLGETTRSKLLKSEIQDRLDYEKDAEERFKENDGSSVYMVANYDADGEEGARIVCADFETVRAFARRWNTQVLVRKLVVASFPPQNEGLVSYDCKLTAKHERFRATAADVGMRPSLDETCVVLGEARLTEKGKFRWLWSAESTCYNPTPDGPVGLDEMPETFETQFYTFPLPDEFKRNGAIVEILRTGEVGVLCAKSSPLLGSALRLGYADYSDVQQIVMIPCINNGEVSFTHEHINPLFLQTVSPTNNGEVEHDVKIAMAKKLARDLAEEQRCAKTEDADTWDVD